MKRDLADVLGDKIAKQKVLDEEPTMKIPKIEDLDDDFTIPSPTSSTPPPLSPTQTSPVLAQFVEITCGSLTGTLHMELFICPGIRERCISTACAPGVLLTPVEFTIKADKSRQKDWKGAIKHKGKMLRQLMEFKQLDFYNHSTNCSYKCHSRNYISPKNLATPKPEKPPKPMKNPILRQFLRPSKPMAHLNAPKSLSELLKTPEVMAFLVAQAQVSDDQKRLQEVEKHRRMKQTQIYELMVNDPPTFWTQLNHSKLSTQVLNSLTYNIGMIIHNVRNNHDFDASAIKLSKILEILGVAEKLPGSLCGEFMLPVKTERMVAGQEPSTSSTVTPTSSATPSTELCSLLFQNHLQNIQNSSKSAQNSPTSSNHENVNSSVNNNNNNDTKSPLTMSSSEKLDLMLSQIHS